MLDHLSMHVNAYDRQRLAAVESIDRRLAALGAPVDDYVLGDVNELLDRRSQLVEYLRTGPHA